MIALSGSRARGARSQLAPPPFRWPDRRPIPPAGQLRCLTTTRENTRVPHASSTSYVLLSHLRLRLNRGESCVLQHGRPGHGQSPGEQPHSIPVHDHDAVRCFRQNHYVIHKAAEVRFWNLSTSVKFTLMIWLSLCAARKWE